ncbi:MAG: retropepsin-like aspartic protease, partial [Gaiellaceae bacterium]
MKKVTVQKTLAEEHSQAREKTETSKSVTTGHASHHTHCCHLSAAAQARTFTATDRNTRLYTLAGTCNGHPCEILIDSGSTHNFIDTAFAAQHNLPMEGDHGHTIMLANKATAQATSSVPTAHITLGDYTCTTSLVVTPLGHNIILGMQWLRTVKPQFDWDNDELLIASLTDSHTHRIPSQAHGPRPVIKQLNHIAFQREVRKPSTQCFLGIVRLRPDTPAAPTPPPDITQEQQRRLDAILRKHQRIFNKLPKGLPPHWHVEHAIELTQDRAPPCPPFYRMSPAELDEVQRQIEELLDQG